MTTSYTHMEAFMNLVEVLKLHQSGLNHRSRRRENQNIHQFIESNRLDVLSGIVRLLLPIAAVLVILRFFLLLLAESLTTESIITLISSLLVMAAIYLLTKTGHYYATIMFAVVFGSAVILIQARNSGAPYTPLAYLTLLPVFSVTLRSPRETIWVSGLVLLDVIVFALMVDMSIQQLGEWLAFFAFLEITLIISTFYLTRLEHDQRELILERENRERLQQFMANVSHDLKTPISVIYTSLHLLEKDPNPDKRDAYVERIRTHAQLLDQHIQSILTMSRLDSDPLATLTSVDLEKMGAMILSRLSPLAEEKHISLHLEIQQGLPKVCVRADDIERALFNLVENALRYTPDGGSVSIATTKLLDTVQIIVKDSGIGIAETDLPHIFERFYRSDSARNSVSGGYGLGLAIVKRVIELHKGSIEVQSHLDQGTSFTITLPINGQDGCKDIREAARDARNVPQNR